MKYNPFEKMSYNLVEQILSFLEQKDDIFAVNDYMCKKSMRLICKKFNKAFAVGI
jgi:hypothetical protein